MLKGIEERKCQDLETSTTTLKRISLHDKSKHTRDQRMLETYEKYS